jgi:hypothetical protein
LIYSKLLAIIEESLVDEPTRCQVDSSTCREDLVRKAAEAGSHFRSAFDWINDKQANLATNCPGNRGLTAKEIREIAEEWILSGKPITCTPERRELYIARRYFHYDIVIDLPDFPRGLYVEMELTDPNGPTVSLLSAHPPSFESREFTA